MARSRAVSAVKFPSICPRPSPILERGCTSPAPPQSSRPRRRWNQSPASHPATGRSAAPAEPGRRCTARTDPAWSRESRCDPRCRRTFQPPYRRPASRSSARSRKCPGSRQDPPHYESHWHRPVAWRSCSRNRERGTSPPPGRSMNSCPMPAADQTRRRCPHQPVQARSCGPRAEPRSGRSSPSPGRARAHRRKGQSPAIGLHHRHAPGHVSRCAAGPPPRSHDRWRRSGCARRSSRCACPAPRPGREQTARTVARSGPGPQHNAPAVPIWKWPSAR